MKKRITLIAQTNPVDSLTASDIKKLIGTDALMIEIGGKSTLPIRIINATTNEVIITTEKKSNGKPAISPNGTPQPKERNTLQSKQLIHNLKDLAENKPMLFLHATANPEETRFFENQYPEIVRAMDKKEESGDPLRIRIFKQRKCTLLNMRKTDPLLDKTIKELQEKAVKNIHTRKDPGYRAQSLQNLS